MQTPFTMLCVLFNLFALSPAVHIAKLVTWQSWNATVSLDVCICSLEMRPIAVASVLLLCAVAAHAQLFGVYYRVIGTANFEVYYDKIGDARCC